MARAPRNDGGFRLSPRQRTIAGWVAAITLFVGIVIAAGVLSGDDSGAGLDPSSSASADAPGPVAITFGTALADDGDVANDTDRFTAEDTFAYSVAGPDPFPPAVYVEVRRTGGGTAETVQPAAEQRVPPERAPAIAFTVPASLLLDDFGPGEYLMLMYIEVDDAPYAEGSFVLVAPPAPSGDS
jgi:hypothetical protein